MYVSRTPPPPLPQPSVKLRQSLWRAFRVKTVKVASPPCSGGRTKYFRLRQYNAVLLPYECSLNAF